MRLSCSKWGWPPCPPMPGSASAPGFPGTAGKRNAIRVREMKRWGETLPTDLYAKNCHCGCIYSTTMFYDGNSLRFHARIATAYTLLWLGPLSMTLWTTAIHLEHISYSDFISLQIFQLRHIYSKYMTLSVMLYCFESHTRIKHSICMLFTCIEIYMTLHGRRLASNCQIADCNQD